MDLRETYESTIAEESGCKIAQKNIEVLRRLRQRQRERRQMGGDSLQSKIKSQYSMRALPVETLEPRFTDTQYYNDYNSSSLDKIQPQSSYTQSRIVIIKKNKNRSKEDSCRTQNTSQIQPSKTNLVFHYPSSEPKTQLLLSQQKKRTGARSTNHQRGLFNRTADYTTTQQQQQPSSSKLLFISSLKMPTD